MEEMETNEVERTEEGMPDEVQDEVTDEVEETEAVETADEAEQTETTEPKKNIGPNDEYASNRRAKEERLRRQKLEQENEILKKSLQSFFPNVTETDDLVDNANALYTGKSIDEIREERIKQQEAFQKQQTLEAELEILRKEKVERLMEEDLTKIQKINPEVKSLASLGEDFLKLIENKVPAEIAYNAVQMQKKTTEVTPPVAIGKVNKSQEEKEFYTPEEVDKLTAKDLDNPKIFARVRESMTKWK